MERSLQNVFSSHIRGVLIGSQGSTKWSTRGRTSPNNGLISSSFRGAESFKRMLLHHNSEIKAGYQEYLDLDMRQVIFLNIYI